MTRTVKSVVDRSNFHCPVSSLSDFVAFRQNGGVRGCGECGCLASTLAGLLLFGLIAAAIAIPIVVSLSMTTVQTSTVTTTTTTTTTTTSTSTTSVTTTTSSTSSTTTTGRSVVLNLRFRGIHVSLSEQIFLVHHPVTLSKRVYKEFVLAQGISRA